MRILFYIEHFKEIGGAENYAILLCKELMERGHEIHVVCKDGDESKGIRLYKEFYNIKDVLKRVRPDISFDWGLFERANISRLGGGIHKIFINHALYSYPWYIRPIKRLLYKTGRHKKKMSHQEYVLNSASTFYIAPSRLIKRHAIKYGIPENRVTVLHNGINLNRFTLEDGGALRNKMRESWKIKKEEVVFLFIAHNLRLKNLALLKRVFEKLYKNYPEIRLIVVGKKRPNFKAPYLTYVGPIQDMRRIYAAGDVLLHPSYFDTFGSVVIEAMASCLPVIVSRFTGASEIVEDGGAVLPVIGNRVEELWTDSIKLMLDKELRLDKGYKARLVAEKHDFSSYMDKIEEIITSESQK